ncbi:DUF1697 domain-containing protein [Paenibacillus xanthanilyticus]|uniref:DUF1697 domain-containing protein n=1 Tax=Paenibacillus xanthanilyticus TaxID=1783531 RepID=A0ABV8KAF6_9BACL
MQIYIALLRGINVSGHNKIPMAELRTLFHSMGHGRAQTYIQSGNVVFEAEAGDAAALAGRIEDAIESRFGFRVRVMVRTAVEWDAIIRDCPYDAASLGEEESIQMSLLADDAPGPEEIARKLDPGNVMDDYRVVGRELYLLLRQRMSASKLADNLAKLRHTVTTRNWRTTLALQEMARAMREG